MQILSDGQFQYTSNQINFIHALPHVLIDSSVSKYCKSFNNMSLTAPRAEWLEQHAEKQGVAG